MGGLAVVDSSLSQEVYFGGYFWNHTGPVRLTNISVPPNPVVFGDTEKQGNTQVMTQFVQSSYLGGAGKYRGNVRTDSTRFWTSDLDTAYLDLLTLPPEAVLIGKPSGETGDCELTISYRGVQYFVFGNNLYYLDSDLETFISMGTVFVSPATDAIVYKDKLYFACVTQITTLDSTLTLTNNTQDGSYFTLWDNKLWTIALTSSGWTVYQTSDGVTWTAGAVLPYENEVTDLITFRDTAGSSVIAAITKNGDAEGALFLYDANTPRWNMSEVTWPPVPDDQECKGAKFRDGKLYINIGGLSMIGVQPGNPFVMNPMGLDQDDGVPSEETGKIDALVADINWMIAKINSTDPVELADEWLGSGPWEDVYWPTYTGKSSIRRWFGGWHKLYQSQINTGIPGKALDMSSSYDRRRLWFSMPDGIYYMEMTDSTYNPRMNPTRRFQDGPLSHVTPWWNYGTEGQDKLHGHIFVEAFDLTDDETITVYYGTDFDESTWVSVLTIDQDGLWELIPNPAGFPGQWFRYQFVMNRGSDATKTPKMRYYRTDTMRLLPATYGFGLTLDLTRPCRDRSPYQQMLDLKALADPAITPELSLFWYRDDDGSEKQYYARISNFNGAEWSGVVERGRGEYYVSLTAPYRVPDGNSIYRAVTA